MWALGVDTSGLTLSVVLLQADGRLFLRQSAERRQQGEVVHDFVSQCVAEAGITLNDIGVIAVVTGPGSFTGLRIGLALAQGFARALGCPIAGYDRFRLIRTAAPQAAIVLDSMRAELFVQLQPDDTQMLLPADILAQLEGRAVAGDGAAQLAVPATVIPPEAELAARQALDDVAAGVRLAAAVPLYVRPPDVSVAKPVT